eukprot:COSAG02_NODE_51859_length_311_cov_0.971698_1_plen_70_part_10
MWSKGSRGGGGGVGEGGGMGSVEECSGLLEQFKQCFLGEAVDTAQCSALLPKLKVSDRTDRQTDRWGRGA